MIYDNIVIGSGISALGCVVGLLESNKKILCIDGSDNTLKSIKNINNDEIIFDNDNLPLKKNSITAKFVNKFDPIKAENGEVNYIGRKPAASPASGYLKKHLVQQKEIIDKVLS